VARRSFGLATLALDYAQHCSLVIITGQTRETAEELSARRPFCIVRTAEASSSCRGSAVHLS